MHDARRRDQFVSGITADVEACAGVCDLARERPNVDARIIAAEHPPFTRTQCAGQG
jgi:hypothetical protein